MKDMTLSAVAKRAHETAVAKGFWTGTAGDVGKKLLLIHSEVTEAAEAVRTGGADENDHFAEELGDVLIRTLDLMEYMGFDVDKVVAAKMDRNDQRPVMHGGKRF